MTRWPAPVSDPLVTVAGMGLVSAWVLVTLAALAALWCAVGAVRLTRRERPEVGR